MMQVAGFSLATNKMFQCTFIKHGSKTEISFSEFEEILSDTFANEYTTAKTIEDKSEAIINLLNTFDLSDDQKLEILSTTRKRLEQL